MTCVLHCTALSISLYKYKQKSITKCDINFCIFSYDNVEKTSNARYLGNLFYVVTLMFSKRTKSENANDIHVLR